MSGTADFGSDYELFPYWNVTIPVNGSSTGVGFVTSTRNDHVREPDETATLHIGSGSSVSPGGGVYSAHQSQGSATVTILDDDWWKVGITADGDAAEPDDDSWAMYDGKFTLTRTKDRDVAYEMDTSYELQVKVQIPVPDPLADPQTIATYGVDYSLCPGTIYEGENPGELFATFVILQGATTEPIDMSVWNDAKPEENEEVTLTVVGRAPGAGDPQFNVDGAAASATVTIEDNDHWSVTFERGAPSGSEPNAIERLPGVVQDYGYYRATRFDANPGDDYKASDRTYPISLTFETTGTATLNSDYTFTALADTVPGGDLEVIGGPTQGSPVVHGGVTYDTWATSIPIGLSESYVRVNPVFDWLDEGEPGNRTAAVVPADEHLFGEYLSSTIVTASWSGMPSTYDPVVPTAADKEMVVIHDGALIRVRTDSNNDESIDELDDDPAVKNNPTHPGRVLLVNTDDDNENEVDDKWERPVDFDVPSNPDALLLNPPADLVVTVDNEDDLAAVLLYVWVDSLTPEDPTVPVEVDVYFESPTDLVMWTKSTKGSRLHRGSDADGDGRIDLNTRLDTLTETNTDFNLSAFMEANAQVTGTVALYADPVGSSAATGSDHSKMTAVAQGDWTVVRAQQPKASAISGAGDTIFGLADQIGLNAGQWLFWLSPSVPDQIVTLEDTSTVPFTSLNVGTRLAAGQTFLVPNTVFMAWCGEGGAAGKIFMEWSQNVSDLQSLGFHVQEFDNDTFAASNPAAAKSAFTTAMQTLWANKELHGMYYMGHGSPTGLGPDNPRWWSVTLGPVWTVTYAEILNMKDYDLGALILHCCYGNDSPANTIVSGNGIYWGWTGVFNPLLSFYDKRIVRL